MDQKVKAVITDMKIVLKEAISSLETLGDDGWSEGPYLLSAAGCSRAAKTSPVQNDRLRRLLICVGAYPIAPTPLRLDSPTAITTGKRSAVPNLLQPGVAAFLSLIAGGRSGSRAPRLRNGQNMRGPAPGFAPHSALRGRGRTSELIRDAVAATKWHYGDPPPLGMVTFINRAKVRPTMVRGQPQWGWTFLRSGFVPCGETKGGLLAMQLLPAAMPESCPAKPRTMHGAPLFDWLDGDGGRG